MTLPPGTGSSQDVLYAEAAANYGAALERLARGYEPDADRRLDLVQEIHVALWRSFASFDGRCSLRTWVYRVAHNVATSQVIRRRGKSPTFAGLEELELTFILTVTQDGPALFAQATGQGRFQLFAESERDFFARVGDIQITFERDGQAPAAALTLHQGGGSVRAQRIE